VYYEYSYNPVDGDYKNLGSHTAELGAVFGYPFPDFVFNETLSQKIMHYYWASFSKTGTASEDIE